MSLRIWSICALLLAATACARVPDEPAAEPSDEHEGRVLQFAFGTTDGQEVTSESTRGRVTVLLFVTTFDLSSQIAAKRLNQVLHTHHPQINASAIALEASNDAPLVDVFKSSLGLDYPVAIADMPELAQQPTLGTIGAVPTAIVLSGEGREIVRKSGVFSVHELESWVARAQRP